MPTLSVLVTVYHKIEPEELSASLASLAAQTRPAEAVVIVEDGPLGDGLREVIDGFLAERPESRVVRLARNQGSGPASAAGLETITTDLFARQDADDISNRERFERQLRFFEEHPDVDVLGTAAAEFRENTDNVVGVRRLPTGHGEIAGYLKINNPISHPTMMVRTAAVTETGGYRAVHHMEDYDLMARLLSHGYRFHNLPEPLVYFRTSDAQFARRTGKGMFAAERHMQRNLVSYGLISRPRSWVNLMIRSLYRALPKQLIARVYGTLFHGRK
ncbi:glycosyltransferase [Corynebacterium halotolerans]|uniref:glycosyltransferase n=1 Tax=Corynebacterium halotolerans TaxID=225326 RepID=UPI003CF8BC64